MNSTIYLHRDDLDIITQFIDAFDASDRAVEIIADNSSGIGTVIKARINGVDVNGVKVTVEKTICDVEDW